MRSVIAFDTWQLIKELRESGMEQPEAEAISKALINALSQLMETKEIATKQDITEVKQDLHAMKTELVSHIVHSHTENKEFVYDIKSDLNQSIHDVKQEITIMKLELKQDIFKFKEDIKNQELKLKAFFIRCLTTIVVFLGGIQTIFHLLGK